MDLQSLAVPLILGAVAGWLAGLIMRGHGLGLVANILVGIIGSLVGSALLRAMDVSLGSGIGYAVTTPPPPGTGASPSPGSRSGGPAPW